MNIYGEGTIEAYTPTAVLVKNDCRAFGVSSLVGWGDAPGEFLIARNGVVVGGARTSDQQRAIQVTYEKSPIVFSATDTLAIIVEHASMGLKKMRVNLIGKYF